jgi:hypothetical protein
MIARFARYLRGRDADVDLPPAELPSGSPVESIEAALGVIPPRQKLPLPRWLGPLAICCLAGFLPWIVYLGLTLPRRARADHYDLAWLGFDGAMWLVLAALGWVALKRHPATGPVAAVAATMLMVDAWFDVTTSSSDGQFVLALILALGAEVPLAVICGWAAVNAERIRARAYHRLHLRWENALGLVRQVAAERAASVSPPPAAPPPQ